MMWVQLKKPKNIDTHGRAKLHQAGEVVNVGKQLALAWIADNTAVAVYYYSPLAQGPQIPRFKADWEILGESMTLFTIPRELVSNAPHVQAQRNAIASWEHLTPRPEIILCCDDAGVKDAAKEFGCNYIPNVSRSNHGVPYLSSAFRQAVDEARYDVLCYANTDIVFTDSLIEATLVARTQFNEFVMVGRRRGIALDKINFSDDWQGVLSKQCGPLDDASAMDYFVFTRSAFTKIGMINFMVGSPAWDNWFLAQAIKLGIPTIDASEAVLCAHRTHERKWPRYGIEHNRGLARGVSAIITDTKYVLVDREVKER
jgi:hypothetical protein